MKVGRTRIARPAAEAGARAGSDQSGAGNLALHFAGFVLDPGAGTLVDPTGTLVQMRPQAWAVLRELALNAGRTVSKSQLLDAVWPGMDVSEGSLAQAICDVRESLGDVDFQIVKTVPRRGYMLAIARAAAEDAPPSGPQTRRSIAVLPFTVADADASAQMLGRGIAFDLIHELARNADLRVVSHQSSFAFAGAGLGLREIGRRLSCRHLVDGVLAQKAGAWVLSIQLLDCETGHVLWSARHDLARGGLDDVSGELLGRLAGGVSLSSLYEERERFARHTPRSVDVYALTMASLQFYDDSAPFSLRGASAAKALLEQALELDSDYAPAWAWLALLEANVIGIRMTDPRSPEALRDCKAHARRAIALDGRNTVAYRALAFAELLAGCFDFALAAAERGVELAPSNADSLQALSFVQLRTGRVDDAAHSIELAVDMHPLGTSWMLLSLADVQWAARRPELALRTIGAVPGRGRAVSLCAYIETGQLDQARAEADVLCRKLAGLTVEHLLSYWSADARDLRDRIRRAASAAGIPGERSPSR